MSAIVSHHRRCLALRSGGGEQLAGVAEQLRGLVQVAAGDQVAGPLADDPGLVQRAGSLLPPGFGLLRGPVQQRLTRRAVTAGQRGISGLPQQVQRHGLAVAVQQPDHVLAEPGRGLGRAGAQRGDGPGAAGGGDGRVIGQQRQPGQLQVQRQVTARPRRQAAPGREQRPGAGRGQGGLLGLGERVDPPGGQRAGGQRQAAPGRTGPGRGPAAPARAAGPRDPPTCPASTSITGSGTGRSNSVTARSSATFDRPGLVQQGVQGQVLQELPHLGIGGQVALRQVGFHAGHRGLGPVQR